MTSFISKSSSSSSTFSSSPITTGFSIVRLLGKVDCVRKSAVWVCFEEGVCDRVLLLWLFEGVDMLWLSWSSSSLLGFSFFWLWSDFFLCLESGESWMTMTSLGGFLSFCVDGGGDGEALRFFFSVLWCLWVCFEGLASLSSLLCFRFSLLWRFRGEESLSSSTIFWELL